MATFTPPSSPSNIPSILPTSRGVQRSLFRHYRARPEGINVYIYSDDTVSESDPDGTNTFWRPEQGSPYVAHVFWGGHDGETVTAEEEALLTAAGYTVDP